MFKITTKSQRLDAIIGTVYEYCENVGEPMPYSVLQNILFLTDSFAYDTGYKFKPYNGILDMPEFDKQDDMVLYKFNPYFGIPYSFRLNADIAFLVVQKVLVASKKGISRSYDDETQEPIIEVLGGSGENILDKIIDIAINDPFEDDVEENIKIMALLTYSIMTLSEKTEEEMDENTEEDDDEEYESISGEQIIERAKAIQNCNTENMEFILHQMSVEGFLEKECDCSSN